MTKMVFFLSLGRNRGRDSRAAPPEGAPGRARRAAARGVRARARRVRLTARARALATGRLPALRPPAHEEGHRGDSSDT